MKKTLYLLLVLTAFPVTGFTQPGPSDYPHTIDYFIPEGPYHYDSEIPQPRDILGFEIGQQHADWNNVLNYMYTLASVSDRVSVKAFGKTNQYRPFIQVVITSPENQQNLETIRKEHLALTDVGKSTSLDLERMPVVVNLMYSIHGNEPSGVNSSLVLAYYLAAVRSREVEQLLRETVIVLTPGLNPDGINRFASWVNSSRSLTDVADLNSREFAEAWPSSRTNHYWADCNRDWLMAQHREGQNALEMYFEWLPNVVNDHHEQGGDKAPFYFSPGHPDRTHPSTPPQNQELTLRISSYTARYLDRIGTLYYSKEGYDDFYHGKGATYPDMHGSVAILLEQLAPRGHLRPTRNNGDMSFAYSIRNQAFAGFATVQASYELRKELLEYQRNFYKNTKELARKDPVQGYLFHARGDAAIAFHFLEILRRHRIEVYHLNSQQTIDGMEYTPDESYVIPVDQKHYSKVRTIMENLTEFSDSTFYDISTWTFPHAFNLQYAPLRSVGGLLGNPVTENSFRPGRVLGGMSRLAYLFENKGYYTSKLITALLREGLIVKAANKPLTGQNGDTPIRFGYGSILVQIQNQPRTPEEIYSLLSSLAAECGIDVYAMHEGLLTDYDLGSLAFKVLDMPHVAMIVGPGMSIPESGEVWMMLDQRFQMPPTLIDYSTLGTADLSKYNVLIMANGTPTRALSSAVTENIRQWVSAGGTLIATGRAYTWTNRAEITNIETVPTPENDLPTYASYASRTGTGAGNAISGVILQCRLDRTHPLGWGYEQDEIAVFRQGTHVFKPTADPYASPLSYLQEPYLSGCLSPGNRERLAMNPAVIIQGCGKGRAILFADDLNFRSYWYGTSKLFMNAILFGGLI